MKKYILAITIILVAILVSLISYNQSTVRFHDKSSGVAKFIYGDINIETEVSDEDLNQLIEAFDGKQLLVDSPSCGFSEDVSVKIDNKTFCVACDTCRVVYLLEEDQYFHLSDAENESIRKILEGYGFKFPCI